MERISHYKVLEKLGAGAMGVVYRAVDDRLGRQVAIKVLPGQLAGSGDMQARLLREAQAASALNHPGIVTVHDIGSTKGQLYIVMELVDGESFSRALSGVSVDEALRLVAEAADALGVAHARGIIHRDVKSDNLMRTRDGRVKVLDFGLAKALGPGGSRTSEVVDVPLIPPDAGLSEAGLDETASPIASSADLADTALPASSPALAATVASTPASSTSRSENDLTQLGAIIGTPAYMAPEQTRGRPADAKSEVFSLGVVLYELLVGKRPFDRGTAEATMRAISTEDPVRPSEAAPARKLGAELDRVVLKALARERPARFQDMASFAAAIREVAARRSPVGRAGRLRSVVLGGAILVAAAIGAAALAVRGRGGARPAAVAPAASHPVFTTNRRITHDVGCEESPSFDTRGDVIFYDGVIDGDYEILSLDLRTDERKRLTHSPGWDYNPAVSPDGKWIAFIRLTDHGRHLMLVGAGGDQVSPPRDLGAVTASPGWSAGELVCARPGVVIGWTVAADGTLTERVLAQAPPALQVRHAAAFSDGEVYAIWRGPREGRDVLGKLGGAAPEILDERVIATQGGLIASNALDAILYPRVTDIPSTELVRRNRDGSTVVIPSIEPAGGFDLSDDARRLVYSTCREYMYIGRVRPGDRRPAEIIPRSAWRDHAPVTLDAKRMIFSSERSGEPQVWMYELENGATRAVAPPGSIDGWPSPDGKWVVHTGATGLGLSSTEREETRALTDQKLDSLARFSGDGKTVVFARPGPDGVSLWAVDASGGTPRRLTEAGAGTPAPARGDGRVVYVMRGSEIWMLDVTKPEAPPARVPGLETGNWTSVRFSRDGKRLLLVRKSTEIVEAWVDGSRAPVTRWTAVQEGIGEVDYAPDGDGYIASVGAWDGDLWLAEGELK